jgi:hypothetical protein
VNRVIIESPYAASPKATVPEHVHYACCAMRHSIDQGEAPFASHLLYPNVLDDSVPLERARGIQAGYEWMQAADIVAFYIDFSWSLGMVKALKVARILQRKIEIRSLEGRTTTPPPELAGFLPFEGLVEAGIIEETDSPVTGVQMFRFRSPTDE